MIEIDKLKEFYEEQVVEILNWIQKKVKDHSDCVFPNSLDSIKSLVLTFNKGYMILEKPPKYKQKSMLDAQFYNINMKLTAQGHPKYVAPEGKTIRDLETAWSRLEKAEHARDLSLKKELNRQEQLEQMYAKFDKKAKLREDWLSEMAKILTNAAAASTTSQIDATFRKQEAIGTDIQARAERFTRLDQLAKDLINEDYFFKVRQKEANRDFEFLGIEFNFLGKGFLILIGLYSMLFVKNLRLSSDPWSPKTNIHPLLPLLVLLDFRRIYFI